MGFTVSFPSLLPLGSANALRSSSFPFPPCCFLASLRSALSFSHHGMPPMRLVAHFLVVRFPLLVRFWLLRVPWRPSFCSDFLYGILRPLRAPSGPCVPLSRMLCGFLCPVGSSPSAWGSPFWPFLFSHRVAVLWFLLALPALASPSPSASTCIARMCSPSCAFRFLR